MKTNVQIILVLTIVIGCKDEFLLGTGNDNSYMVVDGKITNESGPYTIKISKSSPINNIEEIPYENCIVTIYDNNNNTEILTESQPGLYITSSEGIQGTIGNEYKIQIITPEGEEFETEYQKMKEPVEIDSLYSKLIYIDDLDYPYGLPGYQFYINTKPAADRENFLLWSMTETFEYDIDYKIAFIEYFNHIIVDYNPKYDSLETCWNTEKVKYIYTGTTNNLDKPQITKQPLQFESTETKKLTKKYSLSVQQFSIDAEAYIYWKKIEDQNSDQNFLVSTQPYIITGNIKKMTNPDKIVLGYFTVASVTNKRIFVDRPGVPFYYNPCLVITDPFSINEFKKKYLPPWFYVKLDDGRTGIIFEKNVDCRNDGGDLNKPDFWVEE